MDHQNCTFWETESKKLRTILLFMTTSHNVALKTETSFKLQSCLKPFWNLEKPVINVKTYWDMLEMQQTPSFQINYHNPEKYINGPEKNIFLVQNPFLFFFFFFFCKEHFLFFCYKTWTLWRDQWDYSQKSKHGWIRLCASIS